MSENPNQPTNPAPVTAYKLRVFCSRCLCQYSTIKKSYPTNKTVRCPECGQLSPWVFDSNQQVPAAELNTHHITEDSEPTRADAKKPVAMMIAEIQIAARKQIALRETIKKGAR